MSAVVFNPDAGRGSILVFEPCSSFRDQRLPQVVFRHRPSEAGQAFLNLPADFGDLAQGSAENLRHRVARQIIFGGAEAARQDDQGRAGERVP